MGRVPLVTKEWDMKGLHAWRLRGYDFGDTGYGCQQARRGYDFGLQWEDEDTIQRAALISRFLCLYPTGLVNDNLGDFSTHYAVKQNEKQTYQ